MKHTAKLIVLSMVASLGLMACSKEEAKPVASQPAQSAAKTAPQPAPAGPQLSPEERKAKIDAMRARIQERREAMMNKSPEELGQGWIKQFDGNSDGKVTKDEYLTKLKTFAEKSSGNKAEFLQRGEKFFADTDTNKDGTVSAVEVGTKLKPRPMPNMQQGPGMGGAPTQGMAPSQKPQVAPNKPAPAKP